MGAVEQRRLVDEGWGRRAAGFATLMEPAAVREYLHVHNRRYVGPGTRLLDMACGKGLALELARTLGAEVARRAWPPWRHCATRSATSSSGTWPHRTSPPGPSTPSPASAGSGPPPRRR